jgi:hypothetical protein
MAALQYVIYAELPMCKHHIKTKLLGRYKEALKPWKSPVID